MVYAANLRGGPAILFIHTSKRKFQEENMILKILPIDNKIDLLSHQFSIHPILFLYSRLSVTFSAITQTMCSKSLRYPMVDQLAQLILVFLTKKNLVGNGLQSRKH